MRISAVGTVSIRPPSQFHKFKYPLARIKEPFQGNVKTSYIL